MEDKGILEPNIWRDDGSVGASIVGTLTVLGSIIGPGAPAVTTLADNNGAAPGASLVVTGIGPALTVRKVEGGTALTAVQNADDVTFNLDNTAVVPGAYTQANITVDPQGRITAAANGSSTDVTLADSNAGAPGASLVVDGTGPSLTVRKVEGGTGLSAVQNVDDVTVNIDATGVAPGFYSQANITVNAQGQITAAATGSSTDVTLADATGGPGVSLVDDGIGPSLTVRMLEGGTALTSVIMGNRVVLDLDDTAVAPGSYTNANITVDQQGRLTAAAHGPYTVPFFLGNTGANVANNGFVLQQGTTTTEALAQYPVPRAGTMTNMRVRISAAPGGGNTRTITMRLNGANTALVVTISGGAAVIGDSGAATVTVAADDRISVRNVNTGAPVAASMMACFEIRLQS